MKTYRAALMVTLEGMGTLTAFAAYAVDVSVAPEPQAAPIELAPAPAPAPVAVPVAAHAAVEGVNYVDIASQHCRAWLSNNSANMGFALGKAAAKFTNAELEQFSKLFGQKIRTHYGIGATTDCTLKEVNESPAASTQPNKPVERRDRTPRGKRSIAVVSGVLAGEGGVPVAVAYRLEQGDTGAAWRIRSISLNGEPLVDRWREEYEALANSQGSKAVLAKVAQQ